MSVRVAHQNGAEFDFPGALEVMEVPKLWHDGVHVRVSHKRVLPGITLGGKGIVSKVKKLEKHFGNDKQVPVTNRRRQKV